jgi:wyosine [tRNA(Phe)-imidazoG37] synthetase (radical SAM superfamily)
VTYTAKDNNMQKIGVSHVILEQMDGPAHMLDRPYVVKSLDDAEAVIREIAAGVEGAKKHQVEVTLIYRDKHVHQVMLSVDNPMRIAMNILRRHLAQNLKMLACQQKPSHMGEEQWEMVKAECEENGQRMLAEHFLSNYDISGKAA